MEQDFDRWSDAALLACLQEPAASFAVFYRRHADAVLRLFARHGVDAVDAADLLSETFAAALLWRRRFDAERGTPHAWILGIATNKMLDSRRRIGREARARRRLALTSGELTERDVSEYAAMRTEATHALGALAALPEDQRVAVQARLLLGESYAAIGRTEGVSEHAVRQRVSRGLTKIRNQLKEERDAGLRPRP
jgi:RNA polymerase sigma factor (sigma-70 family)